MLEIGDTVYYVGAKHLDPIGEIVGVRETRWSDKFVDIVYVIQTRHGPLRRIYDKDSITNQAPPHSSLP